MSAYPMFQAPVAVAAWSASPPASSPQGYDANNLTSTAVAREFRTAGALDTGGTNVITLTSAALPFAQPLAAVLLQHTNAFSFALEYRDIAAGVSWAALPAQATSFDPWSTGRVLFVLPPGAVATELRIAMDVTDADIANETADGSAFWRLGAVYWFSQSIECDWAPTRDGFQARLDQPEAVSDYANGRRTAAVTGPPFAEISLRYNIATDFGDPATLMRALRKSQAVCVKWPAPAWAIHPLELGSPVIGAATAGVDVQNLSWSLREVVHELPLPPAAPIITNLVAAAGETSARFTFATNEFCTSIVSVVAIGSTQGPADVSHDLTVGGMVPLVTYSYSVTATSVASGLTASLYKEFTTVDDASPPAITNASWDLIGVAEARLTFDSDRPGTMRVRFDGEPATAWLALVEGRNSTVAAMPLPYPPSEPMTATVVEATGENAVTTFAGVPDFVTGAYPLSPSFNIIAGAGAVTVQTFDITEHDFASRVGELAIAVIANANGNAVITEEDTVDWQLLDQTEGASGVSIALFWRMITGDEPTSYTFRSSQSGGGWTLDLRMFDNAAPAAPTRYGILNNASDSPAAAQYQLVKTPMTVFGGFAQRRQGVILEDPSNEWGWISEGVTTGISDAVSITAASAVTRVDPIPLVMLALEGLQSNTSGDFLGNVDECRLVTADPGDDYDAAVAATVGLVQMGANSFYQSGEYWYMHDNEITAFVDAASPALHVVLASAEDEKIWAVTPELNGADIAAGTRYGIVTHPPEFLTP